MKRYKSLVGICILVFSMTPVFAQNDAGAYLQAVYGKLKNVKDYTVQANIKVEMPFIRILPIDVKIYYKQKDKFKVESKGIAIVPRQGFYQISGILSDLSSYTTVTQGEETLGNVATTIVSVISLSDTSDLILGKFWIDPAKSVILKSQLSTRSSGTIVTEYTYESQALYGLPDKMIFSVDAKKFKMPKTAGKEANKSDANNSKNNGDMKGKIYITLTHYQVNKGISDDFFKK